MYPARRKRINFSIWAIHNRFCNSQLTWQTLKMKVLTRRWTSLRISNSSRVERASLLEDREWLEVLHLLLFTIKEINISLPTTLDLAQPHREELMTQCGTHDTLRMALISNWLCNINLTRSKFLKYQKEWWQTTSKTSTKPIFHTCPVEIRFKIPKPTLQALDQISFQTKSSVPRLRWQTRAQTTL